jgi:hypothetical protein
MNKLDHCYLEALSEALKGNLGEALELRNEADALASEGFSFSEDYGSKYPFIEEAVNTLLGSFDFTRCVRADGSAYGTRGKCKKGTEQAKPIQMTSLANSRPKRMGELLRDHKKALKDLKSLHRRGTSIYEPGGIFQEVMDKEEEVFKTEGELMNEEPKLARAISVSATQLANQYRGQADKQRQKLEKLVQNNGSGYIRPGGRRDQESEARHAWGRNDDAADFHDKRAKQADGILLKYKLDAV